MAFAFYFFSSQIQNEQAKSILSKLEQKCCNPLDEVGRHLNLKYFIERVERKIFFREKIRFRSLSRLRFCSELRRAVGEMG